MTGDEILDEFHRALMEHNANKERPDVSDDSYLETYKSAEAAEKAMEDHFGPEGWQHYRARHLNSN